MDFSVDKARRLRYWTDDPLVRGIVGNVADGVVGIDPSGYIELFNAAAERLFGYQTGEVIGRNVSMLMPADYAVHHDDHLRHYLETGERHIIGIGREVTGRRKDGSTFPMYLSVGEVPLSGLRAFIGIVHDLSAQKAAERELAEAGDLLQSTLDSMPSTLVGVDGEGRVTHWNHAACAESGSRRGRPWGGTSRRSSPFCTWTVRISSGRCTSARRCTRSGCPSRWAAARAIWT